MHLHGDVDDALWTELSEAGFDEAARLELLMLAGFYRTVSLLCRALRLAPEAGSAAFPPPQPRPPAA